MFPTLHNNHTALGITVIGVFPLLFRGSNLNSSLSKWNKTKSVFNFIVKPSIAKLMASKKKKKKKTWFIKLKFWGFFLLSVSKRNQSFNSHTNYPSFGVALQPLSIFKFMTNILLNYFILLKNFLQLLQIGRWWVFSKASSDFLIYEF